MIIFGIFIFPWIIAGFILQIVCRIGTAIGYLMCFNKISAKYELDELISDINEIWKNLTER